MRIVYVVIEDMAQNQPPPPRHNVVTSGDDLRPQSEMPKPEPWSRLARRVFPWRWLFGELLAVVAPFLGYFSTPVQYHAVYVCLWLFIVVFCLVGLIVEWTTRYEEASSDSSTASTLIRWGAILLGGAIAASALLRGVWLWGKDAGIESKTSVAPSAPLPQITSATNVFPAWGPPPSELMKPLPRVSPTFQPAFDLVGTVIWPRSYSDRASVVISEGLVKNHQGIQCYTTDVVKVYLGDHVECVGTYHFTGRTQWVDNATLTRLP